jgi:hypothetical protein
MLSSRNGSTGDGTYQELQDDHPQQHELSNMNMAGSNKANGADSDYMTTAESTTTATTQKEAPHPRKDLPAWKWQGTLAVCFLTSLVNGMFLSSHFLHYPSNYDFLDLLEILKLSSFCTCKSRHRARVACPAFSL